MNETIPPENGPSAEEESWGPPPLLAGEDDDTQPEPHICRGID
ncbi:surface protein [Streptomyces sp. N50]|nr:surface protein [Streptomyces sp. N50]WOX17103.1 surface protein [Streptomyces sp. N50]